MNTQTKITNLPPADLDVSENQSNNNNARAKNRPVSFYDNIRINGEEVLECSQLNQTDNETNPTQVHLMNTTVPQNIGASNIGSRHEPTRNSLRHSRMIVMTKAGNVSRKYFPPIIRYHKLAKALLGLQILLGAALVTSSLWLLLWAPNLRTRDNPYWSAIPLLLSGILGLLLLCCFKKEYPGMSKGYFVYFMKITSIILSTIAGAVCLIGCAFAIIHMVSLSSMTCTPLDTLNSTCFCESSNNTSLPIKSYHYVDLSCPEVQNILTILTIFACATSAIGGFVAIWYVYLHWASRYNYTYSKVRTTDNLPVVFQNT